MRRREDGKDMTRRREESKVLLGDGTREGQGRGRGVALNEKGKTGIKNGAVPSGWDLDASLNTE